jgi:metallophosphoesterase (TIGR00282 family)
VKILFVADVFGAPGRRAVEAQLRGLREELGADFCIVNGENAADGRGITAKIAERLLAAGADVITLGNWVWGQRDFAPYLSGTDRVLRPANLSPNSPGRGLAVHDGVAVINLLGQMTLTPFESPFTAAEALIEEARRQTPVIVVDFHAEATSEKVALAYHLDGRVTAVLGTHTHVQTADARVLPGGNGGNHRRGHDGSARLGDRQRRGGSRAPFRHGLPRATRARDGRRAHRGRARRMRRRRPRYELLARARTGRLSVASSATSKTLRSSTTHARCSWKMYSQ